MFIHSFLAGNDVFCYQVFQGVILLVRLPKQDAVREVEEVEAGSEQWMGLNVVAV